MLEHRFCDSAAFVRRLLGKRHFEIRKGDSPVDGVDHTAACIRVQEIVATDAAPEDIFTDDSSDATLAAASSIGERAEVEAVSLTDPSADAGPDARHEHEERA